MENCPTKTAEDPPHKAPKDDTQPSPDDENVSEADQELTENVIVSASEAEIKRLRLLVDIRLCSIAGLLCSLNLLDSGIISSASVTSMLPDLQLDVSNRYSVSIFIFTIASIAFQLPATISVRVLGPRAFFAGSAIAFGIITFCTAFVRSWKSMIAMRVLLGVAMSGIYPGLTYLISTWYTRHEQQLRFALLQSGEVIVLATGGIVNFGLNHLDGRGGLKGWQYMFLVQGLITFVLGVATYWWMVDFPEHAARSFWFLDEREAEIMAGRIQKDRGDVEAGKLELRKVLVHAKDLKVWGFCVMYFLLNLVSTSLSYFLPIILQDGMGFSSNKAILLNAPVYYWAAIPALASSFLGDKFRLRGPVIVFNAICLIVGFCMTGFADQVAVRYIGTYLATGAYVANWAALAAYQANNIVGQWKRVFTAAATTAFNGAGGIAGAYIVRQQEAPRYITAVWVSIGSHIVMILCVALFSAYFFSANRKQAKGKKTLEHTIGFRFTY